MLVLIEQKVEILDLIEKKTNYKLLSEKYGVGISTGPRSPILKKIYFRLNRHFFVICKVGAVLPFF